MQCVILAAGKGTRMGELTAETPKVLLEYKRKPLIEHQLGSLPDEIDEAVVVVGRLGEHIRQKLGKKFKKIKIVYALQKDLNGTAGALAAAKDHLGEEFMVIMGDDLYSKQDLEKLVKEDSAMLVWELGEESGHDFFARIETDKEGNITGITERQRGKAGDLINCGAYMLDQSYFDLPLILAGNNTDEYGLPQTMVQLADKSRKIKAVKATFWKKITTPEDLR